jgi:Mg-chelatase subunit ChlD
MLEQELVALRFRLDALREGQVRPVGLWERALELVQPRLEALSPLADLAALDRELDQVGVHTSADALLLRQLSSSRGRAGELAQGLTRRAEAALREYRDRLHRAERALAMGRPIPGAATLLGDSFRALARAAKVADLFSAPPPRAGALELLPRPPPAASPPPQRAAVAVADFWAERARQNAVDVVQKRRDLDAAHELLLRLGGDADRDRVRQLRMELSDARRRVREAPATRTAEELVQLVRATARQEPRTSYRALRGLYERAVEAGQPELAGTAQRALAELLPGPATLEEAVERPEVVRWLEPAPARQEAGTGDRLAQLAFDLDPERLATFELALGCARYFDVEDALAEEVLVDAGRAHRPAPRRVPYPTQQMTFETTGSLHEVGNFVLSDPRMVVYDLASNRQKVRAYLEEAPAPRPRRLRRTAVRVYVLDASGSMHGARARFRDAIMIAELNNLRLKALRGEPADPVYYSFFNDRPSKLQRVETAEQAAEEIERLFRESPAEGQTQITYALVEAFEQIRAAAGSDPYLSRATVVLVTDGEDRVEMDVLRKAQAPVGGLQIALSFISLGEENRDLKSLVMEQRARGSRAFYHHLYDRELASARTEFDARFRTLLPADMEVTAASLELLAPHLDALEQVARGVAPRGAPRSDVSFDALFPGSPPEQPRVPVPSELAERVRDILEAIGEAAPLAPADARPQESATLLVHLLARYGYSVPQYLAALGGGDAKLAAALDRVRLLCRPFG